MSREPNHSLKRRAHPLSAPAHQRDVLRRLPVARSFDEAAADAGHHPFRALSIDWLQLNLGKRCNLACKHCHVDAGPDRDESMPDDVVEAGLEFARANGVGTVDLTGGAPEMHPRFRSIVSRSRAFGCRVIVRTNLSILTAPAYRELADFLASEGVELAASLPWYARPQTDALRGEGVFQASLQALRALNELGYGRPGSGLTLNLVTNPSGAYLPAPQAALERDWKREMQRRHGIEFTNLLTITNMPVSRYLDFLLERDCLHRYMDKLVSAFNPRTVEGLMCRTMLSVGWDGRLYDCDFNQMLDMPLEVTIFEADAETLSKRRIRTSVHCFGCTAGSGSSCSGATET
ncbi:MAG: arsenosugar biosynthesis radical SAM (seleno)protein ArsS [Myxococcota bacterium]